MLDDRAARLEELINILRVSERPLGGTFCDRCVFNRGIVGIEGVIFDVMRVSMSLWGEHRRRLVGWVGFFGRLSHGWGGSVGGEDFASIRVWLVRVVESIVGVIAAPWILRPLL